MAEGSESSSRPAAVHTASRRRTARPPHVLEPRPQQALFCNCRTFLHGFLGDPALTFSFSHFHPQSTPNAPFLLIAGPATNLLQLQNFPAACSHDIFICQNILPESNFHVLAVGTCRPSSTAVRKRPPGRWKQVFSRLLRPVSGLSADAPPGAGGHRVRWATLPLRCVSGRRDASVAYGFSAHIPTDPYIRHVIGSVNCGRPRLSSVGGVSHASPQESTYVTARANPSTRPSCGGCHHPEGLPARRGPSSVGRYDG